MKYFKVWWHCLLKTRANIQGEDHRIVEYQKGSFTTCFCTCGYLFDKDLTAVADF